MAVVKVISIGKTTTYIHDDGSTTVYSGGTSSWRNNNPGNVNGGPGMLGKDAGGNAIFPDLATGEQARRKLFEPGGSYYDKSSILDAMHTYLPHDDGVNPRLKGNNPDQYTKELKMIAQKNGFDNLDVYNKPIAQLTLEELNAFLEAKKIREGWKVGNIEQFDSSGHPVGPYLPGPNGENLVQPSSSRRGDSDVDCLPDMMNTCRNLFNTATVTPSPIILDLDGDGVETTNFKDGAYFDHDGNGFAEQTGWASSDDGILVMDRNNNGTIDNGKELFGDQTILSNGTRAANGFQALSELDTNADGKIDANDAAFSSLKVWQDLDGDGYSASDELFTLQEEGIQSINVAHTDTNTVDPQGNTLIQQGAFTKTDGTIAQIGGFNLQRDVTYTIANDWLDVPEDIAVLPDLQGYGNAYDLHQTMVRDTTGTLQALIEQFIAEEDSGVRDGLMEQILFKWTGSDTVDPASRGANFDARKLAVIEKLMGQPFAGAGGPNPNDLAAPLLAQAYEGLLEM